jgi:outer membrane biosynthesis protein TonB
MSAETDIATARRILLAVCLSVLVHASLLGVIRAQPGAAALAGSPLILASLEPIRPEAPSEASSEPGAMAVADSREDAVAIPASAAPSAAETAPPSPSVRMPPAAAGPTPEAGVAIELPLGRDLTFYPVAALDTPPRPLGPADLCYPEGASGEVTYVLLIDEAGTVHEATLAAVRPDSLFTGAAIESCRELRFSPGIKDGRAVRSRVRFVIGPSPT